MTLFFLILLTVSLSIFGFQKLKKKTKLTIKPSLPKIEELLPEQPIEKPRKSVSAPMPPIIPELYKEPEKPVSQPANPVSPDQENPMSIPEPIVKKETAELPAEPISLPPEQEPTLLSSKDPEPPANLPIE